MRRRLPYEDMSDWQKARHVLLPVATAMIAIGALSALVGDCTQTNASVEGAFVARRPFRR